MSIGKSSIKRAANNGYSNVKTSAPDMENSVATTPEAPKAEAPKVEAPKVVAPVKTAPKKTAKKTTKKAEPTKQGFVILAIGDDLPYYLL